MDRANTPDLTTPYDLGYASIDPGEVVGANGAAINPHAAAWRPSNLKLHIDWLGEQLRGNPAAAFTLGRYDALCDLLARTEPLGVNNAQTGFDALAGAWRKS